MNKIYKLVLILILVNGCSKDFDQSFQASSLIKPEFNFSNYLIECNLKEGANLLNLEKFFSDFKSPFI